MFSCLSNLNQVLTKRGGDGTRPVEGLLAFFTPSSSFFFTLFESFEHFAETMITIFVTNLATSQLPQDRVDRADMILVDSIQAGEEASGVNDTESLGIGRLLHIHGNVRAAQGQFIQSLGFYHRALAQYPANRC